MPNIFIRNKSVDVDIRAELEAFDWGYRAKWSHDKLLAQSPFRDDSTPSFYVWLEGDAAGAFGDSGGEGDYAKGNFVKLLAYLRHEDEESTEEYLAETYGADLADYDESVTLDLSRIKVEGSRQTLDSAILAGLKFRHPYLTKRGISERVQRLFQIGYDRASMAVSIPWFTPNDTLAAIKYRSVAAKTFWYEKGSIPVGELIYGMDVIYRFKQSTAILVESETDAMASVEAGVPAIAVGGSSFNAMKRDIIARSPIERLIIATDNDRAGEKLAEQVSALLRGYVVLERARIPIGWDAKDINDVLLRRGAEGVREIVTNSEPVKNNFRMFVE